MKDMRADVLVGTLDLLILKTLDTLGTMHGYGVARRLEQVSGDLLELNHGTVYPALLRLEQKGWIASKWGASEHRRRARFYSLTRSGRRALAREVAGWRRMADFIGRVLTGAEGA